MKKLALVGVLSTLAVTVACGGTSTSGEGGEFAVGALVPLTGGGSEFGPKMEQAIRIAIDEVNEDPPQGNEFKLFVEDGQTDPDAAVRGAQKLINVNKVHAIFGTWSSAVTLAVAPLAIQSGVVHMNTSGAGEISDLEDNDLVWRFQPPASLTGKAVAAAAQTQGWQTAAGMSRNDPSGVGTVQSFEEAFAAVGGEVVKTVQYAPEQTRYTGEVREITSTPTDFIFNSTYVPELAIMLKASAATGKDVNWVAPGWAVNDSLIGAVGDLADGVWGVDSAPNVDGQAYKNFTGAFEEKTGDTLSPSDTYVFSAYDMPIVLGLAMTACECSEGQELTDAIRDVTTPGGTEVSSYAEGVEALKSGSDIDYQGASSNLDFDEKGDQIPAFGLYRVESGEVKLQETFQITE